MVKLLESNSGEELEIKTIENESKTPYIHELELSLEYY